MIIKPLIDDIMGLFLGLDVKYDILGNKILSKPDVGAIELDPKP